LMCGIRGIDNLTYGLVRGSYTIITGMVNGGKTTLMFNIAWNMAKAGYRVVYVSIEKEAVSMYERLLSLHTLIDYNRIKLGGKGTSGLSDYYYQKYIDGAKDVKQNMKDNFVMFQETQGVRLSRILSEADKANAKKPVDVLIVDYLGVIGLEERYQGRNDLEAAAVSSKLQAWGKENKIAVITGMQFNNSATKEIRKKVAKISGDGNSGEMVMNTEDMGTSQKIVADCENNIGVALNADEPPTKMFAHIIKARDNAAHTNVNLDFDGKIGRISDPELAPGQVQGVDDLIYNEEITEDQLLDDDGLFSGDTLGTPEPEKPIEVKTETTEEKTKELDDIDVPVINDDDADFLDTLEPQKLIEKPKGLREEENPVDDDDMSFLKE